MDFFINESQLKIILQEQNKSKMSEYMKDLYSYTFDLVNKVKKTYGLNVKMLLTWGISVAGLLRPLDNWIQSGEIDVTNQEKNLILVGVAMMLFFETKPILDKVIEKIREKGIEGEFEKSLRKATELKSVFYDFLQSMNTSLGSVMDIISYCFLIPILNDIQSFAERTTNLKETAVLIAERLLASGVVVVSSKALVSMIGKLLKRFKS